MSTATTTTAAAYRHLTDQDILEEVSDVRWFLATVTRETVRAGAIERQRRHLAALQAEAQRRRELPRAERLREAARQYRLLADEASEAAGDFDDPMGVASETFEELASRATRLAERAEAGAAWYCAACGAPAAPKWCPCGD